MKEVEFKDIKHLYTDHIKKDYIIFRRDEWDDAPILEAYYKHYGLVSGKFIKGIKPCEHENVNCGHIQDENGNISTDYKYICLQCQKELKPKNGWEVCE